MDLRRWRIFFDDGDLALCRLLAPLTSGEKHRKHIRRLFDPDLHPRGIKELAAPRSLRVGCAVLDLLSSLEGDSAAERLRTLRAVRDEVLHSDSPSMRNNTARVLLQVMKDLVRSDGDELRQLKLAHDFSAATTGKPRLIRRLLRRYHLLEMPEAWNQMAFDFHVHDANSKGRKTPTHLVMDAWIKGIRHLGVVYYNHLTREAVSEMMEAAEIMGVHLRIGVEMPALYRGRYVPLIWAPRGFHSHADFVAFLEEPGTRALMEQGREVARYQERHHLRLLRSFNERHLPALRSDLGIEVGPIGERPFLDFVGKGQTSTLHLAEFIHGALTPALKRRLEQLKPLYAAAAEPERVQIRGVVERMNRLVPDVISDLYLSQAANPDLPDPRLRAEGEDVPELLRQDLDQMLSRFEGAPRGNRTILNASDLSPEEVVEVLYLARGRITHLEIFNLKDWAEQGLERQEQICRIRQVINRGNVVETKRLCLKLLARVEACELPDREDRIRALRGIVRDIPRLHACYRHSHLKSRLGSDSTGRSHRSLGMGMVALASLPWRTRRRALAEGRLLPARTMACRQVVFTPILGRPGRSAALLEALRKVPVLRRLGYRSREEWFPQENATTVAREGNIAALGGAAEEVQGGLALEDPPAAVKAGFGPGLGYLRTPLKNLLKVLVGFLPALLTFLLTKDWWLLAYLGAPIWFAITGLRNVVQSVVGGGGLARSHLLKWSDFVSWSRVADSLLFTGFSVPLLDFLVKQLLLAGQLGITTRSNPLALYTVIALANGVYISSHNLFRGLPTAAAAGNFFRTVISIPIALGLNELVLLLATERGIPSDLVNAQLQLWAAVISKLSSDLVAGFIEGMADRGRNMNLRWVDYRDKRRTLNEVVGSLALFFPEQDVLELMTHPKEMVREMLGDGDELMRKLISNSLDLMYFWYYQPRGRQVFRELLARAGPDERLMLLRSQQVLERKRMISELLLDGLVGKNFDRPLAFYLSRTGSYLAALQRLEQRH